MIGQKRWQLYPQKIFEANKLAKILNISPIIAQLLMNRNLDSLKKSHEFIYFESEVEQFEIKTLEKILFEINACIEQQKGIFVFGDYDVDGMSSTAMMVKCITTLGGIVRYKLPHRFNDGYGLNESIIPLMNQEKCGLLITLDCGITNIKEVQRIKDETQAKVIIIDHHQIPNPSPNADIILNSKSPDVPASLVQLCTAGIVYKLVDYIASKNSNININEYLFLAAIGTVADVVELQDENRRIVKKGLQLLKEVKHIGVNALLDEARWYKKELSVYDVGFVIAPRLNAAGRLSTAHYGVELLLSQTKEQAKKIAQYLERINKQRKALDASVVQESLAVVDESQHYNQQKSLVLGKHGWHAGVIGIAASKLVHAYAKPVVIVGLEDNIGRGSARSFGNINIYGLLKECKDYFMDFGGHKLAAGFSIKPDYFDAFKKHFEEIANNQIEQDYLVDQIQIDMQIQSNDITFDLIDQMRQLEPFGQGNPEPIFYSNHFNFIDSRLVGNGQHLKVTVQDKKTHQCFDGIGFGLSDKLSKVYNKESHIIYSIEKNCWNNKEDIQLNIKDIK